jgi:hypothetical protein
MFALALHDLLRRGGWRGGSKQASKEKMCLSSNCRIEKADTKNLIDEGRET